MKNRLKILFLLKKNNSYGNGGYEPVSKSGLLNSALMTAEQLKRNLNIDFKIEICIDGNSIDKEVSNYKPDICILEAIWVTPSKMRELHKLHPNVKFIIRVHSELSFLANEGNAIDWLNQFIDIHHVYVGFNSYKTYKDFKKIYSNVKKYIYLPNIYEKTTPLALYKVPHSNRIINIGCFGAIRPLKNQLIQAAAAIIFANKNNFKLNFHINSSRLEQGGNSVLKNLRSLFQNTRHTLIEHEWVERKDFLNLISEMNIGMQVSYSESFNIVTADFVHMSVPIVVSSAISWMPKEAKAYTNSTIDIVDHLEYIKNNYITSIILNKKSLTSYNKQSLRFWNKYLNN